MYSNIDEIRLHARTDEQLSERKNEWMNGRRGRGDRGTEGEAYEHNIIYTNTSRNRHIWERGTKVKVLVGGRRQKEENVRTKLHEEEEHFGVTDVTHHVIRVLTLRSLLSTRPSRRRCAVVVEHKQLAYTSSF